MVAKEQANRLWAQRGSFDDDFAADERVGDAALDVADDATLEHDRVLDFAAGQLTIGTDCRERPDVRITNRRARSNHRGTAYSAGADGRARFEDDRPDECRFRIDIAVD